MLAQLPFKCGELGHKTYQRPTWDALERARKRACLVAAYEVSRFILSFQMVRHLCREQVLNVARFRNSENLLRLGANYRSSPQVVPSPFWTLVRSHLSEETRELYHGTRQAERVLYKRFGCIRAVL